MVITPKDVKQTTEAAAPEMNNPKEKEIKTVTDGTNVLKSDLANISLIFCRTSSKKKNRMTVRSSRNQSVHQSVIEKNPPSSSQSTKSKII